MGESTGKWNPEQEAAFNARRKQLAKMDRMIKAVSQAIKMAEQLEAGLGSISGQTDEEANRKLAANYREQAEKLMREYKITEEQLIAEDAGSILPTSVSITIAETTSRFSSEHLSLWRETAHHCGVRYVYRYEGGGAYVATVVGYEADIRYAEFLHSSARLMMIAKLEPTVDRSLSDEENVYRLRSAGIERIRIAEMIWGEGSHTNNAKVTRLYRAACAKRGEDAEVSGRQVSVKTFREVYARAFVEQYYRRLREARDATDKAEGGALVLPGRAERVDEAFYERFPQYRPTPSAEPTEPAGPCAGCAKTKSKTGKCKLHRPYVWTKADEERWDRMNHSASAVAGRAAGRRAADAVEIARGARKTKVDSPNGGGAIEA